MDVLLRKSSTSVDSAPPAARQSALFDMIKSFSAVRASSTLSPKEREKEEKRVEFRFDMAYSLLGVSMVLFALYINYYLLGKYLSCLFFALISSMALRPTKDRFISLI